MCGLRFATLPLLEAFLCQIDILVGCLLCFFDESMKKYRPQRLYHPARGVREQARPRHHPQWRRMINCASAARQTSDLDISLSRATDQDDEQYGMADRASQGRCSRRAHSRLAPYLWIEVACRRRHLRRQGRAAGPCMSLNAGALRESGHQPLDRSGKSGVGTHAYVDDSTNRQRPKAWSAER